MNTSVDPCEDFYEFACGKWATQSERPDTEPIWSQWEPVMKKVEQNIEELITNNVDNDFEPLNKAKKFYEICMNNESKFLVFFYTAIYT